MEYNIHDKPDPRECPRRFCFWWQMGRVIRPTTPDPATVAEGCGNLTGLCTRLHPVRGDYDGYEPDETNLEAAGLPWFYFIPSPALLVPHLRGRYVRESETLWGRSHWTAKEQRGTNGDAGNLP